MATATALIVPVPAAESLVGEHRARFDASAREGMPPHITVLWPFVPLEALGDDDVDWLRELFAARAAFQFWLARVAAFPGVVYLAPEPAQPFISLTKQVWHRWPERPPYGRAYQEVIPHLSVAIGDQSFAELRHALVRGLPIETIARTVWLMARRGRRWRSVIKFPLGIRN